MQNDTILMELATGMRANACVFGRAWWLRKGCGCCCCFKANLLSRQLFGADVMLCFLPSSILFLAVSTYVLANILGWFEQRGWITVDEISSFSLRVFVHPYSLVITACSPSAFFLANNSYSRNDSIFQLSLQMKETIYSCFAFLAVMMKNANEQLWMPVTKRPQGTKICISKRSLRRHTLRNVFDTTLTSP